MAAAFRQKDVERVLAAYQARGLPLPMIRIERGTGDIVALPANDAPAQDEAAAAEQRMREAFGE